MLILYLLRPCLETFIYKDKTHCGYPTIKPEHAPLEPICILQPLLTHILELQIQFLLEKRTEPYGGTVKGVSQRKIGYEAESASGVSGSARKQTGAVCVSEKQKRGGMVLSFVN